MSLLVPLPLPGATVTMDTLRELRKRGVLPSDITAFHALDGFAEAFGGSLSYIPVAASIPKRWSDTGTPTEYLTISGNLDAWDAATWSDFSMQVYGRTIAQFYQDYAKAKDATLRWIPRFVKFTNAQPREMNFTRDAGRVPGPRVVEHAEAAYPLAKAAPETVTGWTWPTNHGLRLNPQTGLVETFDYQEYIRAYPIKVTVSTGDSAGGKAQVKPGQASAFLGAAAQAFFAGNHDAAAADVLAKYVEVK